MTNVIFMEIWITRYPSMKRDDVERERIYLLLSLFTLSVYPTSGTLIFYWRPPYFQRPKVNGFFSNCLINKTYWKDFFIQEIIIIHHFILSFIYNHFMLSSESYLKSFYFAYVINKMNKTSILTVAYSSYLLKCISFTFFNNVLCGYMRYTDWAVSHLLYQKVI